MSLTQRTADWVAANRDRLEDSREVTFKLSDPHLDKPSCHLTVAAGDRFAEVIVWDSGELELACGRIGAIREEHHEVVDPADLNLLLEQVIECTA